MTQDKEDMMHIQVVISSTATFDEFVFLNCSRKSDNKPSSIPQDNKDEANQESLQDYSFPPMED